MNRVVRLERWLLGHPLEAVALVFFVVIALMAPFIVAKGVAASSQPKVESPPDKMSVVRVPLPNGGNVICVFYRSGAGNSMSCDW